MRVNRRDFLKLSGVTVAGSFLGGVSFLSSCKTIPHKLKGAKESVTICPFCSVGCGLIAAVRDGKVVNIEGDPDHPINQGSLCSKGSALFQVSSVNDRRLKYILYRAPYAGKWTRIPWGEAIDRIAEKIKRPEMKPL